MVFDDLYQSSMIYPTTTVASILHRLISTPLVTVREPVLVDASDVGFPGLGEAIKRATSDTD